MCANNSRLLLLEIHTKLLCSLERQHQRALRIEKGFITNDTVKQQKQDYSTNRLMLVEHDFIHHPKYREIEPRIQEMKDKVWPEESGTMEGLSVPRLL